MVALSQVPSIRAAIEEEAETRDAAFIQAPADICGITVLPLTLRRYLVLCASGNAFVCGGTIGPVAVAQFLWCVAEDYRADKVGLPDFLTRLAQLNYGEVLTGVSDYLAFSFFDAPRADPSTAPDVPSYVSFAAVYVDTLGQEYGWSLDDTLNAPLPVIFQLLRRIQQRREPGTILFNPLSDRAKTEYARGLNAA